MAMKPALQKIAYLYSFLRLLSLDIVLGALCSSYFFAKVFQSTPSLFYWFSLANAVWVIYTIDHILDGLNAQKKVGSKAYQFHFRNRFLLMAVALALTIGSAVLVFIFLEKRLLFFGIYTFLLVMIYLALNNLFTKRHLFFPKELVVAVLYSWGIFGGIITLKGEITPYQILVAGTFFLLVLGNVLTLSYFGAEEGKAAHFSNLAAVIGRKTIRYSVFMILSAAFCLSLLLALWYAQWLVFWVYTLMGLTLLILILFPSYFKNHGYYGLIADAIFFFPALMVLS